MDANLLHISYEGDVLEDLGAPRGYVAVDGKPEAAPDQPEELTLTFEQGDVVAIDGQPLSRCGTGYPESTRRC